MTVLIGINCVDGVVIGSDSSATSGTGSGAGIIRTIEQPVTKVFVVGNDCIFAGTGEVGLGQRCMRQIEKVLSFPAIQRDKTDPIEIAKTITAKSVADFVETGVRPGQFGCLVAFPHKQNSELCEFSAVDLQPELKRDNRFWFVSMGSGQLVTDPFLGFMRRVFWPNSQPTVTEAVFLTYWALRHAIDLNAGGVNGPMQIATLTRDNGIWKSRLLLDGELNEHEENCDAAEAHLAGFRQTLNTPELVPPSPPS